MRRRARRRAVASFARPSLARSSSVARASPCVVVVVVIAIVIVVVIVTASRRRVAARRGRPPRRRAAKKNYIRNELCASATGDGGNVTGASRFPSRRVVDESRHRATRMRRAWRCARVASRAMPTPSTRAIAAPTRAGAARGRGATATTTAAAATRRGRRARERATTARRRRRAGRRRDGRAASACPGCGVGLQREDANAPGYYATPRRALEAAAAAEARTTRTTRRTRTRARGSSSATTTTTWTTTTIDEAYAPPGFELVDEENVSGLDAEAAAARLDALNALFDDDEDDEATKRRAKKKRGPPTVVCARCFALRTSGRVKNAAAEALLPSFDFARVVGDSFERLTGEGRAVVLLTVDLLDFDGSFPVDAIDVIEPYVEKGVVDVLLVANKVDLMPTQCTRTRLTSFVRRRSKDFGLSRCAGVHLVSAKAGMGVAILAQQLEDMLDRGKEVYVVGAQNAGKSSLINRLSQRYGGPGEEDGGPIASPLPGTTLGMVKLPALLPNSSDVYDTPGLLQPFQLSSRLNGDEMKMVLPNKRVTPRTYRIEVGGTIHIGGLARIDVLESPQRTLYLTVWASNKVATHYARTTKGADTFLEKHGGTKMMPPIGEARMRQFGTWGSRVVNVYGEDWQASTRDISIAGLCWIGVGCNGNASFKVWTHEGVQVVTREALVPDMAKSLMSPGFSFENVGGDSSNKRPNDRANRQRGRGGGGGGGGGEAVEAVEAVDRGRHSGQSIKVVV